MASINVELPEAVPNWDESPTKWGVELWDNFANRRYAGEVVIRPSDHRIHVSVPHALDTPQCARNLAAALLACAEAMDAGVRPTTAEERIARYSEH